MKVPSSLVRKRKFLTRLAERRGLKLLNFLCLHGLYVKAEKVYPAANGSFVKISYCRVCMPSEDMDCPKPDNGVLWTDQSVYSGEFFKYFLYPSDPL